MHPEFRLCIAGERRRQHGNGIGFGNGNGKKRVDKERTGERKGQERIVELVSTFCPDSWVVTEEGDRGVR